MASFETREVTPADLFDGDKFYRVPNYQRPFSWDDDHFEDLINDTLEANRLENYFIGTVVFHETDVRSNYGRAEWEANFEVLGQHARDPNAHWRGFGLDLCCQEGRSLHCLEVFGRQLICALDGLHPQAVLAFAESEIARAA